MVEDRNYPWRLKEGIGELHHPQGDRVPVEGGVALLPSALGKQGVCVRSFSHHLFLQLLKLLH